MNKINLCKSACFVVLNLYYTGCLLRICSVVRFLGEGLLCNRGFAAKLFFKRYIAVVIGRSPWRRPGIVFDKKDCFGRAGFSVRYRLASLSVFGKEKTDSFRAILENNPTARFDGGQNGVRRLCETPFTSVLCRLHIVRTSCIYPCEAAAFFPHPDVF